MRTHRPALITSIVIALVAGAVSFGQPSPLSLAGGADGSAFAAVAKQAAEALTSQIDGMEVVDVVSAGSIETLERVLRAEVDVGLAYGGDASLAYRGLAEFDVDEEPGDELRAIGFLYEARSVLATAADAPARRGSNARTTC